MDNEDVGNWEGIFKCCPLVLQSECDIKAVLLITSYGRLVLSTTDWILFYFLADMIEKNALEGLEGYFQFLGG